MRHLFFVVSVLLLCASLPAQDTALTTTSCVILKRTAEGKQFQYIEGNLPSGVLFHGRLGDRDVQDIMAKGGRVVIVEQKYSAQDMENAGQSCRERVGQSALPLTLQSQLGKSPTENVPNRLGLGETVGLTGTWRAQNVAYAPWTLNLRAEGNTLTGTVKQETFHDATRSRMTSLTQAVQIYDGTIQGNKISFKCDSPDGRARTVTFSGEINGSEIKFTRTVQVKPGSYPGEDGVFGASGASSFTARRD